MAERRLEALRLLRVVAAREEDDLPRRLLADLERGDGHLVLVVEPHRVDGPHHLRVHGVAQAVLALHDRCRVLAGVRLDSVDQLDGGPRALERSASAPAPELDLRLACYEHVRAEEVAAYEQREVARERAALLRPLRGQRVEQRPAELRNGVDGNVVERLSVLGLAHAVHACLERLAHARQHLGAARGRLLGGRPLEGGYPPLDLPVRL